MLQNQRQFFKFLYRTINILTIPIALLLAIATRFGGLPSLPLENDMQFLMLYSIFSWLTVTSLFHYYDQSWHSRSAKTVFRASMVTVFFFSLVGVISFYLKEVAYSRILIALMAFYQWIFVLVSHHIIRYYTTRQESLFHRTRNLLIVGDEESVGPVLEEVHNHPQWSTHVVGHICDDKAGSGTLLPYLGNLSELARLIKERRLQEILVTLPLESHMKEIMEILDIAETEGVRSQLIPQNLNQFNVPLKLAYFGSIITYRVRHIPLDSLYNRFIKRLFDIASSFCGLIVLLPIFIPAAIAIKLADRNAKAYLRAMGKDPQTDVSVIEGRSTGSTLFKQLRTGYNQEDFTCLKFRSMTNWNLQIDETTQPDGDDPRLLKLKIGPWVFPLGKFLRKSNIDELPQLVNVLIGDMSLVGPRPHMLDHTEEFKDRVDSYMIRHFVRPGITGLAQVNGYRGKTDTKEKLEGRVHYDIKYIETWSLALDIQIILETIFSHKAKEKDL